MDYNLFGKTRLSLNSINQLNLARNSIVKYLFYLYTIQCLVNDLFIKTPLQRVLCYNVVD